MAKRQKKFASIDEFEDELDRLTRGRFNRRNVFAAGNYAALFDAVAAAIEDAPDNAQPDDTVAVRLWVLEGVFKCLKHYLPNATTRQKSGRNRRWVQRFRQDLVDWGRYREVWYRVIARRDDDAPSPGRKEAQRLRRWFRQFDDIATTTPYPWSMGSNKDDLSVFEAVAKILKGSAYQGSPTEIRKSYERVNRALRGGEAWRYYPSKWFYFKGQFVSIERERAQ